MTWLYDKQQPGQAGEQRSVPVRSFPRPVSFCQPIFRSSRMPRLSSGSGVATDACTMALMSCLWRRSGGGDVAGAMMK